MVERQAPLYTATRFDVFPGGCLTTRITAPEPTRSEVTGAVPVMLGFVPRAALRAVLEQRSDGRLHLDPPPDAR